ncbi:MAG: hypothetical protein M3434_06780 [Gemmatimonadota bacterium]|jgi:hypothetical protein|nr:hypothetical protein [Gemmatimonadota bacterium]
MNRPWRVIPAVCLALGACSTPPRSLATGSASEGGVVEQGTFVLHMTHGAIREQFTRTPEKLQAERLDPNGFRQTILMTLKPDASAAHLEVLSYAPGSLRTSQPVQRSVLVLRGDSAIAQTAQGDTVLPARAEHVRGGMPYVYPSVAALEQLIRRARRIGGIRVRLPLVHAWGIYQGAESVTITFGGDSAFVDFGGFYTVRVQTDAVGRVLGGSVPEGEVRTNRIERISSGIQ